LTRAIVARGQRRRARLEHKEADMRRLEQAPLGLAAEDRAIFARRSKVATVLVGSLCLMLVAGLGYYVAHGGQSGAKAAVATAQTSARTPPAQQLGLLVIWASMAVTDW
jgi:hypothetical protein